MPPKPFIYAKKPGYCFFAITGLTRHLPLTYPRFYGMVLRHAGHTMNVRLEFFPTERIIHLAFREVNLFLHKIRVEFEF